MRVRIIVHNSNRLLEWWTNGSDSPIAVAASLHRSFHCTRQVAPMFYFTCLFGSRESAAIHVHRVVHKGRRSLWLTGDGHWSDSVDLRRSTCGGEIFRVRNLAQTSAGNTLIFDTSECRRKPQKPLWTKAARSVQPFRHNTNAWLSIDTSSG